MRYMCVYIIQWVTLYRPDLSLTWLVTLQNSIVYMDTFSLNSLDGCDIWQLCHITTLEMSSVRSNYGSYAFCRHIKYSCIYKVCMRFVLNESLVVKYFNVVERSDKLIFDIRH